jgi:hypothetical protein
LVSNARRVPSAVRAAVRRGLDTLRNDDESRAIQEQITQLRKTAKRLRSELAATGSAAGSAATKPISKPDRSPGPKADRVDQARPTAKSAKAAPAIVEPDPELGYLFIVAYGRSGSTLLQGILNSIPGYDIHGENRGALHDLFRYHATLDTQRVSKSRPQALSPQSSWYGIDHYDHQQAIVGMRSLVVNTMLCPAPGTRVVGFKEIRWFYEDWKDYVGFLRSVFPGSRFLLNTRSHEAVAQSKWWADAKNPMVHLQRYEAKMVEMAAMLGDDCYRVHYDDYINDPANLAGLFSWLDEPLDIATIQNVMAKKHSY